MRLKEQWSQEYERLDAKPNLSPRSNTSMSRAKESMRIFAWKMRPTPGSVCSCSWERRTKGEKELIAVIDGYRESKQSWRELLFLSLKQHRLTIS